MDKLQLKAQSYKQQMEAAVSGSGSCGLKGVPGVASGEWRCVTLSVAIDLTVNSPFDLYEIRIIIQGKHFC